GDVLGAQLGASGFGEKRGFRQRSANLGLCRLCLELLVLPREPLRESDFDLTNPFRVRLPVRSCRRRKHFHVTHAGYADFHNLVIFKDCTTSLSTQCFVLDGEMLEQRHQRLVWVFHSHCLLQKNLGSPSRKGCGSLHVSNPSYSAAYAAGFESYMRQLKSGFT